MPLSAFGADKPCKYRLFMHSVVATEKVAIYKGKGKPYPKVVTAKTPCFIDIYIA
jgi:hypothetical protein